MFASFEDGKIAYMIYDYFRMTGTHGTIMDTTDLVNITYASAR